MKTARKNVYEIITSRIIEKMESDGLAPWHKPWKSGCAGGSGAYCRPVNLATGKAYRGINTMLLGWTGFSSKYWMTYKQAKKLGGHVNKGAASEMVVFWKPVWKDVEDKETGEVKQERRFILRYYRVFNLDQCTIPEDKLPEDAKPAETEPADADKINSFEAIESCEATVAGMPKAPVIRHSNGGAYYLPSDHLVNMPKQDDFNGAPEYYSTLFHELAHSTGHKNLLNRKGVAESNGFGSDRYSKEELIAEMTAAFLCADHNIENNTIDNSAAYVKSWVKRFKDKPRMVVIAAQQAEKAARWIKGEKIKSDN